ncbi:MAG: radical SAM protein [Chloroflexi bacterium]|nr:radical SAM protein [Chloroflexota bacterium]
MATGRAQYHEVQCHTALNRVAGMGFRWSLNPYQGCVHGCHYCYARRYYAFLDLDAGDDFTGIIFVKVNILDVLRCELSRPSWQRERVAVGTATDPYQPIEGKYRLTRGCLQVLCERRTPVSLVTKGTMALRDADVLADLARRAGCTVCFSITTLDSALWRKLEPGTPSPWKRLEVMERLVQAGITAGVLLAPVLPGLTDSSRNLEEVVRTAAQRGACFLGANVLNLKEGTKEHFLGFLKDEYPEMVEMYQRLYPAGFAPKQFQERVHLRVAEIKQGYGLPDREALGRQPQRPSQLPLLAQSGTDEAASQCT